MRADVSSNWDLDVELDFSAYSPGQSDSGPVGERSCSHFTLTQMRQVDLGAVVFAKLKQ